MRAGRAALGLALALVFAIAGAGLIAATGRTGGTPGPPASGPATPVGLGAASGTAPNGTDASVAGRVAVSAVIVRLELLPRKPKSKRPVEVRAVVTNLSVSKVGEVVVELTSTPTLALSLERKVLRGLAPSRAASATWSLCSTTRVSVRLVARATVASGGATASSAPLDVRLAASGRC